MTSASAGSLLDGVDGVLLDIDDTLVDTRAAFGAGIAAIAAAYLPHLGRDEVAQALAMWRADASGHYRRHTRGELTSPQQRMLRARELHERFGGPALDEASFAAWDEVWRDGFEGAWRAHDDAAATVRALREAGYAVGALTNAVADLSERKLARCGLADDVPLLVSLDTLGFGKPDPRVFHQACRRLGTAPGRTAYVGDELDTDALAASAAGLRGIWLDRPGARRGGVHLEDPDVAREEGIAVIGSLSELAGGSSSRS